MPETTNDKNVTINKKVCMLGDFAVGKTSLVRRFVYERFEDKYLSTLGVKISRKTVAIPFQNQPVEMAIILWDLAGSEEFNQIRASYMRGASGIMLVCDLTRPDTFQHLPVYVNDIQQVCPGAQIVLAANKVDLINERRLSSAEIEAYVNPKNIPYFLTSAKLGDRVESIFQQLGQLMLANKS
jgi:small GTP-binding protein